MYYEEESKDEEVKVIPFDVICNHCGSHNVTITAFEYWDLEIKCNSCDSCLSCGRYNSIKKYF